MMRGPQRSPSLSTASRIPPLRSCHLRWPRGRAPPSTSTTMPCFARKTLSTSRASGKVASSTALARRASLGWDSMRSTTSPTCPALSAATTWSTLIPTRPFFRALPSSTPGFVSSSRATRLSRSFPTKCCPTCSWGVTFRVTIRAPCFGSPFGVPMLPRRARSRRTDTASRSSKISSIPFRGSLPTRCSSSSTLGRSRSAT
mmetsp:Transcript_17690/g.42671  ORF Transcript_17690/g.42671 Transcript_17690/m.42671 type:complete len:201 (+) Transcript_17690:466-1068(+)